jgi:toxin ParE1/3/4
MSLNNESNPLLQAEAELEIERIAESYRRTSPRLAMQFMRAFRDRFQFISDFPEAAQVVHSSGVRRSSLDGFPYHMYYLIDPDCLYVIAVGHHHQEPFYWLRRIEPDSQD